MARGGDRIGLRTESSQAGMNIPKIQGDSVSDVCPSAQALSSSKARRARRFRNAFLAGIACVQLGPPGLAPKGFCAHEESECLDSTQPDAVHRCSSSSMSSSSSALTCSESAVTGGGGSHSDVVGVASGGISGGNEFCERGIVPQGERGPVLVAGGLRPCACDADFSDWRGGTCYVGTSCAAEQASGSGIGAARVGDIGLSVSVALPVSVPKTSSAHAFDKESSNGHLEWNGTLVHGIQSSCSAWQAQLCVGSTLPFGDRDLQHCECGSGPTSVASCQPSSPDTKEAE